jgi:hypothetical protein
VARLDWTAAAAPPAGAYQVVVVGIADAVAAIPEHLLAGLLAAMRDPIRGTSG